jgi:hypothetical protein
MSLRLPTAIARRLYLAYRPPQRFSRRAGRVAAWQTPRSAARCPLCDAMVAMRGLSRYNFMDSGHRKRRIAVTDGRTHGLGPFGRTSCVLVALATASAPAAPSYCAFDADADVGRTIYPIPVSPLWKTAAGGTVSGEVADGKAKRDAYARTPVLPPQPPGGPTVGIARPERDEILRLLQETDKSLASQSLANLALRTRHIDVQIISRTIEPPRTLPLVGLAQIARIEYKCMVCLLSANTKLADGADGGRFDTHVVLIQQAQLHMVNEGDEGDGERK